MKKYTNIILIIFIVGLAIYIFNFKLRDGFSPGESPGENPPITVDPGKNSSSNLNRIVDAITTAFTATPPPPDDTADPNYQELSRDTTRKTVFSQDKCPPLQNTVDELPIDKQIKTLIDAHKTTMNTQLDKDIAKLDSILDALSRPEKLLVMNPNIKTVNEYGLPFAKMTYDACGNSILNLTVVQGPQGTMGFTGSAGLPGISGKEIQGDNGGKGSEGVNPFKDLSYKELPKWYKFQ